MTASCHGQSTYLDGYTESIASSLSIRTTTPVTIQRWHERLAYRNFAMLERMRAANIVRDFNVLSGEPPKEICEPCIDGKMRRALHTILAKRASMHLKRVYSDVHGLLDVPSRQGYYYWVCFLDCYS